MTVDEIPQRLIDILNERAGKQHSRQGPVVKCLAEILTEYDNMRKEHGYGTGPTALGEVVAAVEEVHREVSED